MLSEEEAVACFDYIVNCQKAHRAICAHFAHKPSAAGGVTVPLFPTKDSGVTLASMVMLAVSFAKCDWDNNFLGREPQPTWRRHDCSTYYEQIVDLIMEHKDQFQ